MGEEKLKEFSFNFYNQVCHGETIHLFPLTQLFGESFKEAETF